MVSPTKQPKTQLPLNGKKKDLVGNNQTIHLPTYYNANGFLTPKLRTTTIAGICIKGGTKTSTGHCYKY